MMQDVDRIIATHRGIAGKPGKQALGHLTRGGVFLLCAAWELYLEEVILEGVVAITNRAASPGTLPISIRKTMAKYVKEHTHELRVLDLAGDGWKAVYKDIADTRVAALNTPKTTKVNDLFVSLLGLKDLSAKWSSGSQKIDDFVSVRGDIAHRGSDAGYVKIGTLSNDYKPVIAKAALETDNAVSTFIHDTYQNSPFPWNRRGIA